MSWVTCTDAILADLAPMQRKSLEVQTVVWRLGGMQGGQHYRMSDKTSSVATLNIEL
jgi:hypothetical protein